MDATTRRPWHGPYATRAEAEHQASEILPAAIVTDWADRHWAIPSERRAEFIGYMYARAAMEPAP